MAGNPTWSFFILKDTPEYTAFELKTLLLQEMFARGILTLGTHNMSFAHDDADVAALLSAYDAILPLLRDTIANRSLGQALRCEPLVPLFKVR